MMIIYIVLLILAVAIAVTVYIRLRPHPNKLTWYSGGLMHRARIRELGHASDRDDDPAIVCDASCKRDRIRRVPVM